MFTRSGLAYNIVRKHRTTHKGDGVCAFISKRWDVVPVALDGKFDDIKVVCFDCLVFGTCNRVRFLSFTDHLLMTAWQN